MIRSARRGFAIIPVVAMLCIVATSCRDRSGEALDADEAAASQGALPAPWLAHLAELEVGPGVLPRGAISARDGEAVEPAVVRLLIAHDGRRLVVEEGPILVRDGSLKFRRAIQSRGTDPPDGWWLLWSAPGGDPLDRRPDDWVPLELGPRIRGYHDDDSPEGHGMDRALADGRFPVKLPFYAGGRVLAVDAKGSPLGSWIFGVEPEDAMRTAAVPGDAP